MTDYKLVPVEPTAEMLQAACDEEQRPLPMWSRMKAIYKAMLAAAPAVQGEPVAWTWISGGRHVTADKPYADQLKFDGLDVRPLYTALQPAEQHPVSHDWDDQDKCRRCGDRDWYASATCTPKQQPEPSPDVAMQVMEALATILRKAQGRTDAETGECIDIGAECMAIRREFDRRSKAARGVNGLAEALEDMLSGWKYIRESHGDLYGVGWDRAENKARAALAAHREQQENK